MTFEEYQIASRKTALYPEIGSSIVYPMLGLAGEAGELSNKVKKIFRDDGGVITDERKEQLIGELGDILWYTAQIAAEIGVPFDEVAHANIKKLASRMERNTLNGAGDVR